MQISLLLKRPASLDDTCTVQTVHQANDGNYTNTNPLVVDLLGGVEVASAANRQAGESDSKDLCSVDDSSSAESLETPKPIDDDASEGNSDSSYVSATSPDKESLIGHR